MKLEKDVVAVRIRKDSPQVYKKKGDKLIKKRNKDNATFILEPYETPIPVSYQSASADGTGYQFNLTIDYERDDEVFINKLKLRWLDIDNLSWSEPEIIEVKWEGSKQDWGYRGAITLETPGNRSCVALLEVVGEPKLIDAETLPW